jgi:ABC-type glycerol-3-phosphate transport system permease component
MLTSVIILGVGSIAMIAPFVWIVQSAFGETAEVFRLPPRWIPRDPTLDNFHEVFEQVPFGLFMFNSLKIAGLITIGALITASTAAFAFARLRFRGNGFLFVMLLSALLIPIQTTIVPLFILLREAGLFNTHWALILPGLVNPFGVFLLRQHFLTIPSELVEAARVDGASWFTIYWRIFLPLSGPMLTTLAILAFVYWWNEFFIPLILISRPELQVITVGLTIMQGRYGAGALGPIAAGITMAVVPVLIVFLLLQRYIIKSVVTTGLK